MKTINLTITISLMEIKTPKNMKCELILHIKLIRNYLKKFFFNVD